MRSIFFLLSLFFPMLAKAQYSSVVPVGTNRIAVIDSFAKGPELQVINAHDDLQNYPSFAATFGDHLAVRMIYGAYYSLDLSFVRASDLLQGLEVIRHDYPNIIILPSLRTLPEVTARIVRIKAIAVAKELNAMVIIDPPANLSPAQVTAWRDSASELVGQSNVSIYYPDMIVTNPVNNQRYTVGPSSVVASMYAQTDDNYGVWYSPARFELPGAEGYTYQISSSQADYFRVAQNGVAINPIVAIPSQGNLVMGATTADSLDEYRYIAHKRTSMWIETSISSYLAMMVHTSADKSLAMIKVGIPYFMKSLVQMGAVAGSGGDDTFKLYSTVNGNTLQITLDFSLTTGQMTRLQFTQLVNQ
jgi:phage tail sheath protein FI